MEDGALVLEGGSLRCLFTAGVLDVMLENKIDMSYVIGVSAGSMAGFNYISKQVGRTRDVNIEYVNDKRYLGVGNLINNGGIFNFGFLFGEISEKLIPFDFEEYNNSKQRFVAVATNCMTGKPEYFEKGKFEDMFLAASASCSMPILSSMITIDGKKYLDGGVSQPIAYNRAIAEGYKKIVVVLTRQRGYRKKIQNPLMIKTYDKVYKDYPNLQNRLYNIPNHYNYMQEEMDRLEAQGRIFIIRPQEPVNVSRVEKDKEKLTALYNTGRKVMESQLDQLKKYLDI